MGGRVACPTCGLAAQEEVVGELGLCRQQGETQGETLG